MDLKTKFRAYVMSFPGKFVGVFDFLAEILATLETEWEVAGRKKWATVFRNSSKASFKIARDLEAIQFEFDIENANKEEISDR